MARGKKAAPKKAASKKAAPQLKSDISAITKPAIQRLARRGGVKRIDGDVYEDIRIIMKGQMEEVLDDALTMMRHDKRKMLMAKDVISGIESSSGKRLAMAKGQRC